MGNILSYNPGTRNCFSHYIFFSKSQTQSRSFWISQDWYVYSIFDERFFIKIGIGSLSASFDTFGATISNWCFAISKHNFLLFVIQRHLSWESDIEIEFKNFIPHIGQSLFFFPAFQSRKSTSQSFLITIFSQYLDFIDPIFEFQTCCHSLVKHISWIGRTGELLRSAASYHNSMR